MRLGAGPRGFFFDFDGVLAPIQEDPDTSVPDPGVLAALYRLAALTRRVAVVSARPVSFLARHVADPQQVALFGLYGLESRGLDGASVTDETALGWTPRIAQVVEQARAELPEQIRVENKGLALALHYRRAPELRAEVEAWAAKTATATGLSRIAGRMVIELRPPGHDKGSVVTEQTANLASAWYFGDDISDLEAFRALRERTGRDPDFVATLVAVANPESGGPLREAADLCVESTAELRELLDALVAELTATGEH